jgi:hypothetical protein
MILVILTHIVGASAVNALAFDGFMNLCIDTFCKSYDHGAEYNCAEILG